MKAYIRSAACISPQQTFNQVFGQGEFMEYNTTLLNCIEPDYNDLIDPKLIRRMSRIIKMSVACAFACLKTAGIENPDAIVTGTAYGCLEDTGIFLTKMTEQDEEPIAPTAFVQSTHNTIGAQIALLLHCHQYNNTFVSGGASFESALMDAMMLLAEQSAGNVLIGGMDEITSMSHTVLTRMGLYKRQPVSTQSLFNTHTKGTVNGEGSAFFLLTKQPSTNDMACFEAVGTFYKPGDISETEQHIHIFLTAHNIELNDVDLLILGNNGDSRNDDIYTQLQLSVFVGISSINYKHLCGEYPTSTAFATWLAANIIHSQLVPKALGNVEVTPKKVLIYNHYQNVYHSLILLSSC